MSCAKLGFRSKAEARRSQKRTQSQIKGVTAQCIYRCPDPECRMFHTAPRPPAREVPPRPVDPS
jgi:hypothetical protein